MGNGNIGKFMLLASMVMGNNLHLPTKYKANTDITPPHIVNELKRKAEAKRQRKADKRRRLSQK